MSVPWSEHPEELTVSTLGYNRDNRCNIYENAIKSCRSPVTIMANEMFVAKEALLYRQPWMDLKFKNVKQA